VRERRVHIFVSYAREDAGRAVEFHDNLTEAGHDVWFDRDLRGGDGWWEVILEQVRSSDLFISVLSPDSVKSRACRSELIYAESLERTIIPVKVREVDIEQAPDAIQSINVVEFVSPSTRDWLRLTTTVQAIEAGVGLPEPLPESPRAPIADLAHAREIANKPSLTGTEQRELLRELGEAVREEDDREAVVVVLERFRGRGDLLEVVADEIDDLLLRHRRAADAQPSPLVRIIAADLKKGRCTPILGSGMTDWLFGSRRDFAQKWAREYPFLITPNWSDDLPQVTQYAAITYSDLVLRDDLIEFYREQLHKRYPNIVDEHQNATPGEIAAAVWDAEAPSKPDEPHRVLAQLGCSIYLTAQPSTLLVRALEEEGREPVTDFCRWKPELLRESKLPLEDPDYVPSPERPLVYHILGTLDVPESIVITEDEYFDFLAALTNNGPSKPLIPYVVEEALASTSLLFVGFGLQDWDFRILLRALINSEAAPRRGQRPKHVAAETGVLREEGVTRLEGAKDYIVSYFRENQPSIEIEWASVDEFAADIARAWEKYR
jgi:hypothetical protein